MILFGAWRRLTASARGVLALLTALVGTYGFVSWESSRSKPVRERITAGIRLQKEGQDSAAAQQWIKAVELDPNSAEAWELLGDYYFQSKNYKAARSAFERLETLNPNASDLQTRLAVCAFETQDLAAARSHAEAALKQAPDRVVAMQVLAEVEKQSGDSTKRLVYLQRLVDLQPQNASALSSLVDELGRRQEYDKALPLAERLVDISPKSSLSYYLRGLALFTINSNPQALSRAEDDFKKVLQINPKDVEAHRYLGRIYMGRNQPRLAIREFEAIGRGRPYASAHLLELSNAYRSVGNNGKAEQLRTLFTKLNDFNSKALNLDKAIELNPRNAENYLQMSLLLTRGMESDENICQLYRYRYLNNEFQSVSFYLDKALQLQPSSQRIQKSAQQLKTLYEKHLEEGLQALGQRNESVARKNLVRAVLLRPNDTATQEALRRSKQFGITLIPSSSTTHRQHQ